MKFTDKVEKALSAATTLAEVEWIENKVETHPDRPNYRTKEGREIREKLREKCNDRALELIEEGGVPFE